MAILKISKMGHPVLRQTAEPFSKREILLPQYQQLAESMVETMHDHDGIGLAAPQIHVPKRVCVIEVPEMQRSPNLGTFPLTFLFNPEMHVEDSTKIPMWEGCLSIPGVRGHVPRYQKVLVTYLDLKGKERRLEATGFLAGVIQHEIDHLDGILFLDRMRDLRMLSFTEEWSRYLADTPDIQEGKVKFLG